MASALPARSRRRFPTPASVPARTAAAALAAAALVTLAVPGDTAAAQSGRQIMIMETDDGSEPQVLHFTAPDFKALRTPDYVRRDLPTFRDRLELDELQQLIVQTLLEAYLSEFKTLADAALPRDSGGPQMFALGGPGQGWMHGGEGVEIDGALGDAINEALAGIGEGVEIGGPGTVELMIGTAGPARGFGPGMAGGHAGDDDDTEGESVEVAITMMADVDDGEEGGSTTGVGMMGAGGAPGVFVAVQSGDGEIPEELRKKIEEQAVALAEKLQAQMDEAEANGEPAFEFDPMESMEARRAHMEEMAQKAEDFEKTRRRLKKRFEQDVQAQLSPDQMEQWPSLERALTREKTLPDGRLDGERTDLIELLDDLDLDLDEAQQENVDELMQTYELTLHDALVRRNEQLDEANAKLDKYIQEKNVEKAMMAAERASRLRVSVRDTNRRYADLVAEVVDGEDGAVVREAALRDFHPTIYRTTRGQRAFAAVRGLDDLDPELRGDIDEINESYLADLDVVNARIRTSILTHQPEEGRRAIAHVVEAMKGEPFDFAAHDQDPMHAAFQRRTDLDERYMKILYRMLTPEQVERLPKLPSQVKRQTPFTFEHAIGE